MKAHQDSEQPTHTQERQRLAEGPIAKVDYCNTCEQIHLHIGALTLRLEPDAFRAFSIVLAEARRELDKDQPRIRLHH